MNDTECLDNKVKGRNCNNFSNLPLRDAVCMRLQYHNVNRSAVEEWVQIPGFRGYLISSAGRVKHLSSYGGKQRLLIPTLRNNTSFYVTLSDENGRRVGFPLDRLMVISFKGLRSDSIRCVMHFDEIPHNCKLENLGMIAW